MTGLELYEYLAALPEDTLRRSQIKLVSGSSNIVKLVTAKSMDMDSDGEIDTIYLIHK